jgi:hypothetical protein
MPDLPPTPVLVETRRSLHRVAEHVLSAALKTATGHIALQPGPDGFRTPALPDGTVVAVEGTEITVAQDDDVRRAPLTTVAAAAELAGIAPGFPWTKHPPATPLEPDAPLSVDRASAAVLAGWFALGAEALTVLAAEIPQDEPGAARIYPEHFDLGMVADQVNYGVSPGDDAIELPYLYVGPHEGPPERDAFWNAPFGAFRTIHDVRSPDDALAFFRAGRERVREARTHARSAT